MRPQYIPSTSLTSERTKHDAGRQTDNLLAGRALDEPLSVSYNGHFYSVADTLANVKFIFRLGSELAEVGGCTGKNWPGGGTRGCKLERRVGVITERADSQYFTPSKVEKVK